MVSNNLERNFSLFEVKLVTRDVRGMKKKPSRGSFNSILF